MKENGMKNIESRMNLGTLTWPILIEQLLRIMFMNVDVIMIGYFSSKAVAAVGPVTQMSFFVMILYMIVGNGAGIVMSQRLGAEKDQEAGDAALASVNMMLVLGVFLSVFLFVFTDRIIGIFGFTETVSAFAREYWVVFALTSLTQALNIAFATVLRSYGFSKEPMMINMGANVVNIIGNYIFLFGPLGLPVLGITGVAVSTSFSRGLAAVVMGILILRRKEIWIPFQDIFRIPLRIYRSILAIGIPNAGEMLSYNTAQLTMVTFVAQMGTASLAAMTYTQNIGRMIFACALALGMAGQILTGYLVGAARYEEARKRVLKSFSIAISLSAVIVTITAVFRYPVISFLTDDQEVIALVALLMLIQIPLELGRSFNLVFINAMKGAGDVRYPVIIGILSMWGFGVFFSWFLGLKLAWGIAGVWVAIALDEGFRGMISSFRWYTGGWYKKRLARGVLP